MHIKEFVEYLSNAQSWTCERDENAISIEGNEGRNLERLVSNHNNSLLRYLL